MMNDPRDMLSPAIDKKFFAKIDHFFQLHLASLRRALIINSR
jgi:hypothetical protein